MLSVFLSAIFPTTILGFGHTVTAHNCIQPETLVVHHQLRLVDFSTHKSGYEVERSNASSSIPLPADGSPVRLKLGPDEQVRLRAPDGTLSQWGNPLTDAQHAPEALETPAWSLGTVWYNIFPERFDNADPRNDQAWPHATPAAWSADWFEVTPDEFEASANRAIGAPVRSPDHSNRRRPPLADVVFERRYGGDLQGARRRLDHIASLGATSIWFCPIFEAVSLHKYEATDHRHIDPHFAWPGTPDPSKDAFSTDPSDWIWTPADREFVDAFLPAARAKGLRVILDGVWNHVGTAHPAFGDAMERGKASPYAEWFELRYDPAGCPAGWRAWDRANGGLPVFRQIDGDLVPGPKQYAFDATSRWMDPNGDGDPSDGIDGWRLDVANEVGLPFWKDWRRHVREINPEAVLIGELWFDGRDYFGGRAFDSQMNYPLAFVLLPWLSGVPNPEIANDIERTMSHHPATVLAQMNLLASHDTARLVSLLANPGLEYDRGAGMGNQGFNRSRPTPESYDRLELAYAVLTMLPGSPMVFAGDEMGIWGGDDPENRKPLPWPDVTTDPGLAQLATETTARLAPWLRLRSVPELGPILRYGGFRIDQTDGMLQIERDLNGARVRMYANPTDEEQHTEYGPVPPRTAKLTRIGDGGVWIDLERPSEKR